MDQRLRLLTAATVMLIGLGLALFFRRSAGETNLPVTIQSDPLVLRKQPDPRTLAAAQPPTAPSQPATPTEPQPARPTIVTPSEQPAPPPELPKSYPTGSQPPATRWGSSMSEMLPESASAPPTHKIIDGDSLALLAERYLGSASRADEIFAANRNVLSRPEILPIGVELKIPRAQHARAPVESISQKP